MTQRFVTGTTQESFQLGLSGPTIRGGGDTPLDVLGADGDLFVRVGSSPGLYGRMAGSWRLLREEEAFVRQTVARGETLAVTGARLVTVYRNPYTIDTIDMTIDTTFTTIDAGPTHEFTTVVLPTGVEGQSLTIKDVSGRHTAFEIRVTGQIDNASQHSMAAIGSKLELVYSSGYWRVVGR